MQIEPPTWPSEAAWLCFRLRTYRRPRFHGRVWACRWPPSIHVLHTPYDTSRCLTRTPATRRPSGLPTASGAGKQNSHHAGLLNNKKKILSHEAMIHEALRNMVFLVACEREVYKIAEKILCNMMKYFMIQNISRHFFRYDWKKIIFKNVHFPSEMLVFDNFS